MFGKSKHPVRVTTASGLEKAAARIEQKTAEDHCRRAVRAFELTPSPATLQAASAALEAYEKTYLRWIAPVLARTNGQGLSRGG